MVPNFAALARATHFQAPDTKRGLALIGYWRASLVSRQYAAVRPPVDFNPSSVGVRAEGGDVSGNYWQCLTIDAFRSGIPPEDFARAVFARSDARIDALNQKRAAMKPPRVPLEYPNEFASECSPFSVSGRVVGRNAVREMPVFASVIVVRETRSGPYRLCPGIAQDGPPSVWLSRRHFSDSAYGSRTVRFGTFGDYLDFVDRAAWLVAGWSDLIGFLDGSWIAASGVDWSVWLQRVESVDVGLGNGWIREGLSDGSSAGLIRQFDDLREWVAMGNPAQTFLEFCSGSSDTLLDGTAGRAGWLLGHVGGTALARSQRDCASAASLLPAGKVLAVNGPPGTGKTTLLRSVLADLVVRSALEGREPPLVLATAATNQAVTNIIDAFGRGIADEGRAFGIYGQRWIPDLTSYGAYVRAATRSPRDDWSGQVVVFDPISAAAVLSGSSIPSHSVLEAARNAMARSRQSGEFNFRDLVLRAIHDDFEGFWTTCASKAMNQNFASRSDAQKALKIQLKECVAAINAAELLIEDFGNRLDQSSVARASLRSDLYALVHGNDLSQVTAFREIEKVAQDADGDFIRTMRGLVDLSMRRFAFQLAARWWEGEFIRRACRFREHADRIELWRIAACVTPCIVGTPDRFANVFTRWTRAGAKVMWGEADLIVVDEAGQASCDRSAAVFGYAERALVVGDVLQISPVEGEDAPMWGPTLARRNNVFDEDAIDRGLLIGLAPESMSLVSFGNPHSIEGSVMRAASAASWCHSVNEVASLGKGVWLLDHFRCRPRIIEYSNRGWYHGALSARRQNSAFPYPEFGHVDIRDDNASATSRANLSEARAAIAWMQRERTRILLTTGCDNLESAIAIVTPFRDQAIATNRLLKTSMGTEGERITCGTLHSLQGAERPIIIMLTAYSGAYFLGDHAITHFLDRQSTLLNVAVSRARDAFLVFGDRRVFDRACEGGPTAALGSYLKGMR